MCITYEEYYLYEQSLARNIRFCLKIKSGLYKVKPFIIITCTLYITYIHSCDIIIIIESLYVTGFELCLILQ